jgi:hypothetical protein
MKKEGRRKINSTGIGYDAVHMGGGTKDGLTNEKSC